MHTHHQPLSEASGQCAEATWRCSSHGSAVQSRRKRLPTATHVTRRSRQHDTILSHVAFVQQRARVSSRCSSPPNLAHIIWAASMPLLAAWLHLIPPQLRLVHRRSQHACLSTEAHACLSIPSLSAHSPGAPSLAQLPMHSSEHVKHVAVPNSRPRGSSRSGSRS